jgi:hypothetical protein
MRSSSADSARPPQLSPSPSSVLSSTSSPSLSSPPSPSTPVSLGEPFSSVLFSFALLTRLLYAQGLRLLVRWCHRSRLPCVLLTTSFCLPSPTRFTDFQHHLQRRPTASRKDRPVPSSSVASLARPSRAFYRTRCRSASTLVLSPRVTAKRLLRYATFFCLYSSSTTDPSSPRQVRLYPACIGGLLFALGLFAFAGTARESVHFIVPCIFIVVFNVRPSLPSLPLPPNANSPSSHTDRYLHHLPRQCVFLPPLFSSQHPTDPSLHLHSLHDPLRRLRPLLLVRSSLAKSPPQPHGSHLRTPFSPLVF